MKTTTIAIQALFESYGWKQTSSQVERVMLLSNIQTTTGEILEEYVWIKAPLEAVRTPFERHTILQLELNPADLI